MKRISSTTMITAVVSLALFLVSCGKLNQTYNRNSPFVVGQAAKPFASTESMQRVEEAWPIFAHKPYESSGINHLTLPFRVKSEAQEGLQEEAYAFSFLLSNSMDWMPGTYCTRHAYFVFKRSRDKITQLVQDGYSADAIKLLADKWRSTHAIGGELIRHEDGYSGVLSIFDKSGEEVFRKAYEQSRGYFELLGDMSCDAMRFFGHEPSVELVEHLRMKRCEQHQSIINLGKAAFAEERSEEEFSIYENILEDDSGFADVRHWMANQRSWSQQNFSEEPLQYAMALDSYLVLTALFSFKPNECPDKTLAAKYNDWIQTACKLMGAQSPQMQYIITSQEYSRKSFLPREMLVEATKVAKEYPNSYWLLSKLADSYARYSKGPSDPAMTVNLTMVGLKSNFVTSSSGNRIALQSDLGKALLDLGYNELALYHLGETLNYHMYNNDDGSVQIYSKYAAEALMNLGRYSEAATVCMMTPKAFEYKPGSHPVVDAGIAAIIGNDEKVLVKFKELEGETHYKDKRLQLLKGFQYLAEGDLEQARAIVNDSKTVTRGLLHHHQLFELMLCAELDFAEGETRYRDRAVQLLASDPNLRPLWIIFDAYDKSDPKPESSLFYDSLAWLHSDDQWVKEVTEAYFEQHPDRLRPDINKLLSLLQDYEPKPWPVNAEDFKGDDNPLFQEVHPGEITMAVKELLNREDYEQAEDLILRCLAASAAFRSHSRRAHYNYLYHIIQSAKGRRSGERGEDHRP